MFHSTLHSYADDAADDVVDVRYVDLHDRIQHSILDDELPGSAVEHASDLQVREPE
jgi:hypothetical protein